MEYEAALIKEESTSELLRFTLRHILNQVHNQPEYLVLKREQEQQQKQVQNNQQQKQLHSQVVLPSTITTASHQHQVSSNLSRRNNLDGQNNTITNANLSAIFKDDIVRLNELL